MAKQKGIIKIQGTVDDLTFMKTKDGYTVREKLEGFTRDQINNNPDLVRIKENVTEFTKAANATKQLRNAVQDIIKKSKDRRLTSRLTKVMMQVVKADSTNVRGERNVTDGELGFLKNFDFNGNAPLQSTLKTRYTYQIDRPTGEMTVDVPPFVPLGNMPQPVGATHFKIISAALEIDFDSGFNVFKSTESADIPINNTATADLNIQNTVTANSVHPLFLFLGIQYYQVVNGIAYSLKGGEFNALSILDVQSA